MGLYDIDWQENFEDRFLEVYYDVSELLDLDPELAAEHEPEIATDGIPPQVGIGYDVENNRVNVSPVRLEKELLSGKGVLYVVSSVSAKIVRDFHGSGDKSPRYRPERHFFHSLAGKHVIEKHYQVEKEPNELWRDEITELKSKSMEEVDDMISGYPSSSAIPYEIREEWNEISRTAGSQAAHQNYEEAVSDEQLIHRSSEEIRDRYGLDERIENILQQYSDVN